MTISSIHCAIAKCALHPKQAEFDCFVLKAQKKGVIVAIAMQVLEQSVMVFSQNYWPLCWANIKQAIAEQFWIDLQANLE